eukprot:CAMPEP_0172612230 /NCGR_PEP_ID=MMETSP1068-20121228/31783_1 /TAXON_ID=35684 /ORGANISM="Pseudopedinella elastica, Strain CCMP716" /LENGTH=461 /DNA_ID=CAMNT_0013416381 /DNA_START=161 /DNA_END=1546 /DNA_ORIENTATION=-
MVSTVRQLALLLAALVSAASAFQQPRDTMAGGRASRWGRATGTAAPLAAARQTLAESMRTLGLPRNAPLAEVKRAYRRQITAVHPDRDPSLEAQQKYLALSTAYKRAVEELDGGGSGSKRGKGGSFDFIGFAADVYQNIAVPLARDVAAPLAESAAEEVAKPFVRSVAAQARAVASGSSWQAGAVEAKVGELQRQLDKAADKRDRSVAAFEAFDSASARPKLERALLARSGALAEVAEVEAEGGELAGAMAQLNAARVLESEVLSLLGEVREGVELVEQELKSSTWYPKIGVEVTGLRLDPRAATQADPAGEEGGEGGGKQQSLRELHRELLAVSVGLSAVEARAMIWSWRTTAPMEKVEPVIAALKAVKRDLNGGLGEGERASRAVDDAEQKLSHVLVRLNLARAREIKAQDEADQLADLVGAETKERTALDEAQKKAQAQVDKIVAEMDRLRPPEPAKA